MIYVAVAALLLAAAAVTAAGGLVRSLIRQQAREREALLNRVMHLADKTWEPPPAEAWQPPPEQPDLDRYMTSASELVEEF